MARDDEGDGVPSQGLADGSGCGGSAHGPGQLAIAPGLSCRDLSSGFIHPPCKRARHVQVKGDVPKILSFTLEVPADFLDDLNNFRWRVARFARAGAPCDSRFRPPRGCFRKLKEDHCWWGIGILSLTPGNAAGTQGRLEETVGDVLHGDRSFRTHLRRRGHAGVPIMVMFREPGSRASLQERPASRSYLDCSLDPTPSIISQGTPGGDHGCSCSLPHALSSSRTATHGSLSDRH